MAALNVQVPDILFSSSVNSRMKLQCISAGEGNSVLQARNDSLSPNTEKKRERNEVDVFPCGESWILDESVPGGISRYMFGHAGALEPEG